MTSCIHCAATPAEIAKGEPLAFFWTEGLHAADRCTYGLGHEMPAAPKSAPTSGPKRDPKLCVKCGLHPRNPASSSSGCEHVYGGT